MLLLVFFRFNYFYLDSAIECDIGFVQREGFLSHLTLNPYILHQNPEVIESVKGLQNA